MDPHKQRMRYSSDEMDWRTPPALVTALQRHFPLDIDLAATLEASVITFDGASVYLGPDHPDAAYRDSLHVPWHTAAKCGFLNPPYSLTQYSAGLKAGIPRSDLQYLLIQNWAWKAYQESLRGFTSIGLFPYSPQTEWFRQYVMGHDLKAANGVGWSGHAALDCWRIPHRVSYLRSDGQPAANANVNSCVVQWGPNPGFQGPWSPSMRYWSYR